MAGGPLIGSGVHLAATSRSYQIIIRFAVINYHSGIGMLREHSMLLLSKIDEEFDAKIDILIYTCISPQV